MIVGSIIFVGTDTNVGVKTFPNLKTLERNEEKIGFVNQKYKKAPTEAGATTLCWLLYLL